MKIRNGFVSNSSSSSFIVSVKHFKTDKMILSFEDQEKLLDFGFKFTDCLSINHYCYEEDKESEENYALGISMNCNQDEVISFLLKNNIPFCASIHYNHRMMFYQKDEEHVLVLNNFGVEYATYHFGNNEHENKDLLMIMHKELQENMIKIPIQELIEEEEDEDQDSFC